MITIIPAIDIIEGQCVRLTQGDYQQKKVYNTNPLEVAKAFENAGIEKLHLVDLDGAKSKKIVNYKVLESIASNTNLKIDFGGGIQSNEDIQKAFNAGANQITAGSIAVKDFSLLRGWIKRYGQEKIILGADVKGMNVAINAWQETTDTKLLPFINKYREEGITYCVCTDVAKDGLLEGSSQELYKTILKEFPDLKLIASGGVRSIDEIKILDKMGCYGVIIGKAIYENKVTLKDLEKLLVTC